MEIDISGVVEDIMVIQLTKQKAIEEYIRNQLQEDIANDQISMKRIYRPVHGWQEKKADNRTAPLGAILR